MTGTCVCCDEPGQIIAYGWRWACYSRWYRARKRGEAVDAPPPPTRVWMRVEERLAEYAFLVEGGTHPEEAGRRVGIEHERTVRRYESLRKARRAA